MSGVMHIERVRPPYSFEDHARLVNRLRQEDGRGLATYPGPPAVRADGESVEKAVRNARDAFEPAMAALADMGRDIPAPAFGPMTRPHPTSRADSPRACPGASMRNLRGAPAPKACRSFAGAGAARAKGWAGAEVGPDVLSACRAWAGSTEARALRARTPRYGHRKNRT